MALFVDALTIEMAMVVIANAIAASLLLSLKSSANAERLKAHGILLTALAVPSLALALFTSAVWPLPGSYNIIFGDVFLLFSAVVLAAGLLLYLVPRQYSTVSVPLLFAGLLSVVYGAAIYVNGMTSSPLVASGFFVLEGLAAVSMAYSITNRNRTPLNLSIILIVLASLAVAAIYLPSIFSHATAFAKWVPG
ncbi:MAG: DUF981 family protein [Candidatus Micrarchaeota archaeon]|nr:DUF981 family protein [Candidatus Micrarchaeota archaeon]